MPNRVRFYPYKVTYIDLHDLMNAPNAAKLPVFTDIIRAQNAEDAKTIFRAKSTRNVAFLTSGRHPERLGTSAIGVQLQTLSKRQLKAINAVQVPHAINPKAFATKNPTSTLHSRPTPIPIGNRYSSAPIGARQTVEKSTPINLSSSSMDVGGFSVGFRKPGDAAPATPPPPARPTPQPDIYGLANTTVPGGSLVSGGNPPIVLPTADIKFVTSAPSAAAVAPALDTATIKAADEPSPVAVASGFSQSVTAYEKSDPDETTVNAVLEAAEAASTPAPKTIPNPFFASDLHYSKPTPAPAPIRVEPKKESNWIWGLIGLGFASIIHLVKPSK